MKHWSAGVGLLSRGVAGFAFDIPPHFNMGVACSDAWVGQGRTALLHLHEDGRADAISFDALSEASNRLAHLFYARGVRAGDRVAVLLPQTPEAAYAHLAAWKLGAISVPLFQLFGTDALQYRLADCGAVALVTDAVGMAKIEGLDLPDLRCILRTETLPALLQGASPIFTVAPTLSEAPALLIYTSGTTGQPKGALHAHRTLLGHLPGVELPHEMFPKPGDLIWTPADWAWIGGLLDVLVPGLFHGVTVLAHRMAKFDPEWALTLMARHNVRNTFLPPTALRVMRAVPRPQRFGVQLRSLGSGGESLGAEMLEWGRATFGVPVNEFYGQTECNLTIAACAGLWGERPGRMGRAVPGHDVRVLRADGSQAAPDEEGEIAVRRGSPSMFLGYWNRPAATAQKFQGDWLLTGDQAARDGDGWFRFIGRQDDVITSSGYRIGPGEIEAGLARHPAVAMSAVVGLPDALRTEIVVAVVVPVVGVAPSAALAAELQDFIRQRVAGHAYPREVRFAETLPMTTTGKIMRGAVRRSLLEGS